MLLSKDFTFKSLLDISALDLAEILGIDEYIAKIIIRAIKESVATKNPQNLMIHKRNQYALQAAYFIGLTGVGYDESSYFSPMGLKITYSEVLNNAWNL